MKKSELLREIYDLMLPIRKKAKQVNFGSASKKDAENTIEIIYGKDIVKIQVL